MFFNNTGKEGKDKDQIFQKVMGSCVLYLSSENKQGAFPFIHCKLKLVVGEGILTGSGELVLLAVLLFPF